MPNRKSVRLKEYNYSQEGIYFVTICTKNRINYFGEYVGATQWVALNKYGQTIENGWRRIADIYNVELDEFIIMPNHIHGIIVINDRERASQCLAPTKANKTLGYIIGQFKSSMTKAIKIHGLNECIWQRNYYEHIIQNENELNTIREYIRDNPLNWDNDEENIL